MTVLENDKLKIEISSHGAELCRIYDKTNGRDVLWNGDAKHWNRHAPVLFPFVGRVYNNVYRHNGKTYEIGQHGFARDMEFELISESSNEATYKLSSNEETLKKYPFEFDFYVTHKLCENSITVQWRVENRSNETMYFSVGGHPAFLCPVLENTKQSDYFLAFTGKTELECVCVDAKTGTIRPEQKFSLKLDNGVIPITEHTFDNDALVFDDNSVEKVSLLYPNGREYITLDCTGFASLGIWSKPALSAPFVCLEPWQGRCDNFGYSGELKDKYSVQSINPNAAFEKSYSISVW